ncbi:RNA methyltransferase [Actinocorallia libanotica]|uniref:RNA methyltransferase n=1 Tax=Actinocorallia libanotica TaxID=46162 RepID=A0ABN1QS50_9ACTN
MAELIHVPDAADPRLADYVRLTDGQLRRSLEAAEGLFIAEGAKVIRRALASGHLPRSILMAERWLDSLADVLPALDCPVYLVSDATAEALTGFAVHRGALASLTRLPLPDLPDVLASARRVIILEDLVNHTNVGAIFRCAAALDVDAVILAPRCADPLYRRSVKVSMGAVFAVPYARMTDWHKDLSQVRAAGFRLLALTPADDALDLEDAVTSSGGKVGLLLGSEGDGLSSHWISEADAAVRIPMSPTALAKGVDSLNVVAAAAIACYTLTR